MLLFTHSYSQGYETTATAATNVCALLAIYPETQQKLFDEIRSVLPDQESDVTQEDIKNMPYLDAFTKESLRFWKKNILCVHFMFCLFIIFV